MHKNLTFFCASKLSCQDTAGGDLTQTVLFARLANGFTFGGKGDFVDALGES
jgi:hypothetical protein